jgi:MFS family permease
MYSICTNFFPDNKDAMVGYIEAVTGVGLILGPLLGSGLYALGGYVFIFYSFGSIFIGASFIVKHAFGEDVDTMGVASRRGSRTNSLSNKSVDDDFKNLGPENAAQSGEDDYYLKDLPGD